MMKVLTRPMNTTLNFSALMLSTLIVSAGLLLAGCEEEGSMEQLGEKADEAVNDASRAAEDATD